MPIDCLQRSAWRVIATILLLIGAAEATPRAPSPDEIIGNEECRMQSAREHALLYWPSGEGSRFAVLDGTGTVSDGELPFGLGEYRKTFLIERGDGSVLFAFADLVGDSRVFAEPDALAPVRVYLDGKAIYETDNAGQFDVAADGSSFFAIEPLAQDMPRLTIHEVASEVVRHVDLAERFASLKIPDDRVYVAGYAHTQDEVMIEGAQDGWVEAATSSSRYRYSPSHGSGSYLFYPIDGGERRIATTKYSTIFESSRHAYHASVCSSSFSDDGYLIMGSAATISKMRFLWSGRDEPEQTEVWTRSIDLDGFRGWSDEVRLSDDGAWLMLEAANFHVLDAFTGETVFAFPTAENLSRVDGLAVSPWVPAGWKKIDKDTPIGRAYYDHALARLRNVLPLGATVDDVRVMGGYRIKDGELVLSQYVSQRIAPGERWKSKRFDYVFDMANIHIKATPEIRREADTMYNNRLPDEACRVGASSGNGLSMVGDKLVFQGAESSSHVD